MGNGGGRPQDVGRIADAGRAGSFQMDALGVNPGPSACQVGVVLLRHIFSRNGEVRSA